MKKKLIIPLAVLMILVISLGIYYFFVYKQNNMSGYAIFNQGSVQISDEASIHFFNDGFVTGGEAISFYDINGAPVDPPFNEQEMSSMGGITINASTRDYFLINNRYIYDTSETPFRLIYELTEKNATGIKQYPGFLLLSVADENGNIKPCILKIGDKVLVEYDMATESFHYINESYNEKGDILSIMGIDISASFPKSNIMYYENFNTLRGVLGVDDQILYRVFQMPSRVILVGIQGLMCYNVDGTQEWTYSCHGIHKGTYFFDDSNLFIYSDKAFENGYNCINIDEDGVRTLLEFPEGISDLHRYGNGFIGVRYGRDVVFINKSGQVLNTHRIDDGIRHLFFPGYSSDRFYLLDDKDLIKVYTTRQED